MGSGDVVANRAQPESFESTSSSVLSGSADDMAQVMLGLLAELEASLRGSHTAVVACDWVGLGHCTREQLGLHRALEMLLWPRAWPGTAIEKDALAGSRPVPRFFAECAPALAAELLAAERRVLQGTRLQISEVPRDEEAPRMLQYRQACDASAQVMTTIHEMIYAVVRVGTLTT